MAMKMKFKCIKCGSEIVVSDEEFKRRLGVLVELTDSQEGDGQESYIVECENCHALNKIIR